MRFHVYDVEGEALVSVDAKDSKDAIKKYIHRVNPEFDDEELELAVDDFNGYAIGPESYQEM